MQWCQAIFFYSPASRAQTIEDCLVLRSNGYKWYPAYCDRLLQKYGMMPMHHSTPRPVPTVTIGWGWTEWGAWSDGCPESCGRRCQVRYGAELPQYIGFVFGTYKSALPFSGI